MSANTTPLVVVEVSGGIAEVTAYGAVDVLHLDWDLIERPVTNSEMRKALKRYKTLAPLIKRISDPEHRARIRADLVPQRRLLGQR